MAKLYVVATPIGNLGDMTPRMREALETADLIAAEDTRVTMKLLSVLSLKKPMISCHRHNEEDRTPFIIERMQSEDMTVALTCDAGTPGVSDPGHLLVRAAWDAGIAVIPVSGPSAVATAISVSGFDAREFGFYGFLPREKKALSEKLAAIRAAGLLVAVLYESPHRVVELTEAICAAWPESLLCVCCDLTKKFELILRGGCRDVLAQLKGNANVEKGEYCLVADLSPLPPPPVREEPALGPEQAILARMMDGANLRDAAAGALEAGMPRNEVYRAKLRVQKLLDAAREGREG